MKTSGAVSASVQAMRASVFAELAPRIEAFARAGGELAPLHIGDTYLEPLEAARFREVSKGGADETLLYRYGPLGGLPALLEACMDRLARRGWGRPHVDPSHMLVGAGATHALFCAARAVLEPGDEVVVLAPYWPLSVGVFQSAGARVVEAPLQAPPNVSGLWPTPEAVTEALTRALSPRSKAVYLISPNNPDGSVWSREALMALAHLAERHDLWVFSDEVYADYIYEGDHHSFGCLPGMEDRTFTLYSFSKSHGLAGARVGLLLGPREAMAGAKKVATHTVFNVPVVAQRAALEATLHGHAWMGHAHDAYRQARQIAMASMVRAGISHVPCRGGTYLFLDLSPVASRTTARGVLEHCIDHGVLLAPGEAFGEAFHGWARLCFTAVGPETLAAALARFEEAMHLLRRKNA